MPGRRSTATRWSAFITVTLVATAIVSSAPVSAVQVTPSAPHEHRHGKFLGIVPSRNTLLRSASTLQAPMPLQYHGGAVQHVSRDYALFWAPPSYTFPVGYQQTIDQYLSDVAHDSYTPANVYGADTQYYDISRGVKRFASYAISFGGAVTDTHALPSNGCPNYKLYDGSKSSACLTDSQLEKEISTVIVGDGLPTGLGVEYFLFTPQSVATCQTAQALASGGCYDPLRYNGYCAYHSNIGVVAPFTLYANMGFANLRGCTTGISPNANPAADAVINIVSHEQNETMTDPLGNAWYDGNGNEVGDKCETSYGTILGNNGSDIFNQVIDGHDYFLQGEWSNRARECVQRNTYPQPTAMFTWTPSAPQHGTPVTFSSAVADLSSSKFAYSWSFGDLGASLQADPTHTFAVTGTRAVTLVVTDSYGDQTRIVNDITVI
jgi:hypothetical protein